MRDMPYFMESKQWFDFDFDKGIFVLTEQAPEKARESYKEYLKNLKNGS